MISRMSRRDYMRDTPVCHACSHVHPVPSRPDPYVTYIFLSPTVVVTGRRTREDDQ